MWTTWMLFCWLPPHCTQVPWAIFIWECNGQTSSFLILIGCISRAVQRLSGYHCSRWPFQSWITWLWMVFWAVWCTGPLPTWRTLVAQKVVMCDWRQWFSCESREWSLGQWSCEALWCGWVCMWGWQLDQGLDQWRLRVLCLGFDPFMWPQLSLLTWPSLVDSISQQLQPESLALQHQAQLICEHLCFGVQKVTGEIVLWWHITWLCGGRELIVDDHSFAHVSLMCTWSSCVWLLSSPCVHVCLFTPLCQVSSSTWVPLGPLRWNLKIWCPLYHWMLLFGENPETYHITCERWLWHNLLLFCMFAVVHFDSLQVQVQIKDQWFQVSLVNHVMLTWRDKKDLIRCHCLLRLCLKKLEIHYSLNNQVSFLMWVWSQKAKCWILQSIRTKSIKAFTWKQGLTNI